MNEIYLTIAEEYEKLAAGYRALADQASSIELTVDEKKEDKQISIEEVRAVLAEKTKMGKRQEVKNLLLKYDSGKLSGVNPDDYPALLADAEAL